MMDWMPSDALKNLRHVVNVMDTASKKIFAEKRTVLENEGFIGIAGNRMQGKDIMSIMRQSILFTHVIVLLTRWLLPVRANASSSNDDRLTDSELLGQMK
jgi:hypothetical protein